MTAREWGSIGPCGDIGGDAQTGPGYARSFLTTSPAGFPQAITVSAYPARPYVGAEDEGTAAWRDVCAQTDTLTYLMGADPTDGNADPFDSETDYAFPIDYWPASALDADEQPSAAALDASARAYVENLPTAWLDAMPTPNYPTTLES